MTAISVEKLTREDAEELRFAGMFLPMLLASLELCGFQFAPFLREYDRKYEKQMSQCDESQMKSEKMYHYAQVVQRVSL